MLRYLPVRRVHARQVLDSIMKSLRIRCQLFLYHTIPSHRNTIKRLNYTIIRPCNCHIYVLFMPPVWKTDTSKRLVNSSPLRLSVLPLSDDFEVADVAAEIRTLETDALLVFPVEGEFP